MNFATLSDIDPEIVFDINSDVLSDIESEITFAILSAIDSDFLPDINSDIIGSKIQFEINSGNLAKILPFYLT